MGSLCKEYIYIYIYMFQHYALSSYALICVLQSSSPRPLGLCFALLQNSEESRSRDLCSVEISRIRFIHSSSQILCSSSAFAVCVFSAFRVPHAAARGALMT